MRIPLPGGETVDWTAEEAAIAMRSIAEAMVTHLAVDGASDLVGVPAAIQAASRLDPSQGDTAAHFRLGEFLESDESVLLTPGMRTALQMILHRGKSIAIGDLADVGVFRRRTPETPPSPTAIKSFRTRVNTVLLNVGLTLTYSLTTHEVDVTTIE